ncbi:MAG: tRNA epoxyqueuosine(34) reductase QueG [Phycisphaerales bacterium]|nr:MAG: tRNA epoxyqueuosine(34) reductase QueG [Phycisphaerales bacterium]
MKASEITESCRAMGFALAGVCPARASDRAAEYRAWIDAGMHAGMSWLARDVEVRLAPGVLLPGARSIVVVADQYADRSSDPRAEAVPRAHGRIARYARGHDYHNVMKKRLHALADALRERHPGDQFKTCVDISPLLEREHAARAGLGWVGKHTLLIHPKRGSWLLLGALVTTLDIENDTPPTSVPDHCGACTRCIDACPTGAITPYSVDARKCISYLTIEHRDPIDETFHAPIGDRLFGCDICQDVCPHNSPRPGERADGEANPAYASGRASLPLLDVLGWTDDDRRANFRGTPMMRARLDTIRRNAAICAGNALREHDDATLRARLNVIAADLNEEPMVRHAAARAVDQ